MSLLKKLSAKLESQGITSYFYPQSDELVIDTIVIPYEDHTEDLEPNIQLNLIQQLDEELGNNSILQFYSLVQRNIPKEFTPALSRLLFWLNNNNPIGVYSIDDKGENAF